MARVETRVSGGRQYAYVVEDKDLGAGRYTKVVIRAFGDASLPTNLEAAQKFASALNAAQRLRPVMKDDDRLRQEMEAMFGAVLGAVLLGAVLAWLFTKSR